MFEHRLKEFSDGDARGRVDLGIGREAEELRANGVAGTPSEVIDTIGRFAALGSQRVYLQVLDLSDLDHLELIASVVMPHV